MSKLTEFKSLIENFHRNDSEDPEKKWLSNHAKTPEVAALIKNAKLFTHSELDILTTLSKNEQAIPFKTLQDSSTLSQGMLSRYIERLARQQLIEKYHTPENKKAVVLRATANGREIGQLHQELHKAQDTSYEEMLANYTDEELTVVSKFLNDAVQVRKNIQ